MITSSERHKQIMQSILDKEQEEIRKNLSFREDVLEQCYNLIDTSIRKFDVFKHTVYIKQHMGVNRYIELTQKEINIILNRYRELGYNIKYEKQTLPYNEAEKFHIKVVPESLWKKIWNYIRSHFCD